MNTNDSCDFCGEPDAQWEYATGDLDVDLLTNEEFTVRFWKPNPFWWVCDGCRVLVDDDDPTLLAQRHYAHNPEAPPWAKEVIQSFFVIVLGAIERPPARRSLNDRS